MESASSKASKTKENQPRFELTHAQALAHACTTSPILMRALPQSPFYQTYHYFKSLDQQTYLVEFEAWLIIIVTRFQVGDSEHEKLLAITNVLHDILSINHSELAKPVWQRVKHLCNSNPILSKTFEDILS